MEGETLPTIGVPAGMDRDNEDLQQFVEVSLEEVEARLQSNRREVANIRDGDLGPEVSEVLDHDNIRSVDVRARRFENPRVTVWLGEAPVWANDAWDDVIRPKGLNAYNGRVNVTFDVRPY